MTPEHEKKIRERCARLCREGYILDTDADHLVALLAALDATIRERDEARETARDLAEMGARLARARRT